MLIQECICDGCGETRRGKRKYGDPIRCQSGWWDVRAERSGWESEHHACSERCVRKVVGDAVERNLGYDLRVRVDYVSSR